MSRRTPTTYPWSSEDNSTLAYILTSAWSLIRLISATCFNELAKLADKAIATSCSGFVPSRLPAGFESLISRAPSELRANPFSRLPIVSVLAVCTCCMIVPRVKEGGARICARRTKVSQTSADYGTRPALHRRTASAVPRRRSDRPWPPCCSG